MENFIYDFFDRKKITYLKKKVFERRGTQKCSM